MNLHHQVSPGALTGNGWCLLISRKRKAASINRPNPIPSLIAGYPEAPHRNVPSLLRCDVLLRELPGYGEFKQNVRYRLIACI